LAAAPVNRRFHNTAHYRTGEGRDKRTKENSIKNIKETSVLQVFVLSNPVTIMARNMELL